ncbi:Glycine betaine transporter BetP (plasmid) [Tsukamurella tyrosinosolvens]|uniref:Choline/carnitine/betaine transport n=1 Tax=Tsukamurella tyrosinosolvens TaxID=57704 RepID=A0A1H4I8D1_TSUTY|nr:BCCT family transporter [Tsukamurella tyrosinosolvens]KXO98870.1 choline transporter [Tsukamurella tyrosinosolvens]SEB30329.1 choline/carnitine/betaine transport [Tsukamurella tyrosinosolvens]VEH95606.1 Glycine betaine transporter BetP [Tsukamurella tyrosinosolvens]
MATVTNKTGDHRRTTDWVVFGVTAAVVLAFVLWGFLDSDGLKQTTSDVLNWIITDLGWLFLISASFFVLFAAFLAFSRFGRIPLGRDGERPEFKTVSWIAMMFSAGMGIGLMFFGAAEPIAHYVGAPPGMNGHDVAVAMATTMFHWGFHPWAIYAVVGLAIAYSTYRCGRSQLISSVFAPIFNRTGGHGVGGRVIDILAIFATLFGTTASLGLGAAQVGAGLERLGWADDGSSKLLLVAIIAVLTLAFVASAVSGVAKGIQWLSNTNMVLALVLALFVFVVGPTVFILNLLPTSMGAYAADFMDMSARSAANEPEAGEWLATWSIFYWAWWVSWTPFVGLFLAKISRGRTIREFVIGVMAVPTLVSLVWFAVFGGTAIHQEQAGLEVSKAANEEVLLFDVLGNLPWPTITAFLVVLLVGIFFVSGADSASIVMGTLSQRGAEEPNRLITIFWGVLTGSVAALLLWVSGDDALTGIKQMAIIAAAPFLVVMIGMCVGLMMDLWHDPLIVAERAHRDELGERMRWHANTLAVTDDSTDVLPSADLPVYSDGEVPEDLYHPPHTGELVTIEVYDADHSGPIEIDPKDDASR